MAIGGPARRNDSRPEAQARPRPLVVDVDGTLLKTDLLVESFLHALARDPLAALRAVGALARGKAALKHALADIAPLDMALMPMDPAVLDLIARRRTEGGAVVLASASDARHVRALADHLGCVDGVLGSADGLNLSGHAKAAALIVQFGEGQFDYIGNAAVDCAVWDHAHTAYLAGGDAALARRLHARHANAEVLPHTGSGLKGWLKALRPHQWLKNLLVFVPAAAGHSLMAHMGQLLLAFLAFSLCASSVYIANDLLDLAGDRAHPRKRNRPFASGAVPALGGMGMAVGLLGAAFALASVLPAPFVVALGGYYLLTAAYSFVLKRKPVVDVIALACLYGMRIVAGGYASGTDLSMWLEALAIFLFLSLALVKRCAELHACIEAGKGVAAGRGYWSCDLSMLEAMAAAAGYNAALVLAIYINSAPEAAAYAHPHRLFLLCVLLLAWISRVLVITRRGEMHDDPIVFALRDGWSRVIALVCAGVVAAASL